MNHLAKTILEYYLIIGGIYAIIGIILSLLRKQKPEPEGVSKTAIVIIKTISLIIIALVTGLCWIFIILFKLLTKEKYIENRN